MTPETISALRALLEPAQEILVTTHTSPDGDALGSLTAVGQALQQLGKTFTLACDDGPDMRFGYLPLLDQIKTKPHAELHRYDLLIAVDCGDETRMGEVYKRLLHPHPPIINIDHHITNNLFGTVNVVAAEATSTAEILTDLLPQLGATLDKNMAISLLTGIVTDTLAFRVTGVTGQTLRVAAKLVDAGADLGEISMQTLILKSPRVLQLWRLGLNNMQAEDGVSWTLLTMREQSRIGEDLTSGMGLGNLMADVDDVALSIVFTEKREGRVNISFRSRPPIDVSILASEYGGGGHRQAAGCSVQGRRITDLIPEVVARAKAALASGEIGTL
jgi:bifunctional oligoribonuclease and PAP phosphatase NrnA